MPRRFVILHHTGFGQDHYDLMVEQDTFLATWQFSRHPATADSSEGLPCRPLPDHRTAYLDYQGPVSNGRGEVRQADGGTCDVEISEESFWRVTFHGRQLRGQFELQRSKPIEDGWVFTARS